MSNSNVGFIGGGNMTRAIATGLLHSGFDADKLLISEPLAEQRERLAAEIRGALVSGNNDSVVRGASCVVLATKPQVLPAVCRDLAEAAQETRPLFVSIAAGVHCADIEAWLGGNLAIVRVMPNLPALIRRGVSGIYANQRASTDDVARASRIMEAVGAVVPVDREEDIDIVTAVSGSGPAYFFLLIEMLAAAGEELGLSANAASSLAIQTAVGAAELAEQADEPMQALIARVTSPHGTTAAALDRLEEDDIRAIFQRAIIAARDRAIELADAAHDNQD
jgi:pyrroline-5-carboxylate reductase